MILWKYVLNFPFKTRSQCRVPVYNKKGKKSEKYKSGLIWAFRQREALHFIKNMLDYSCKISALCDKKKLRSLESKPQKNLSHRSTTKFKIKIQIKFSLFHFFAIHLFPTAEGWNVFNAWWSIFLQNIHYYIIFFSLQ